MPNYKKKEDRTNMLMFNNLPVLNHKATFYNNKTKVIKAITFEDVNRCLEKDEAKDLLEDKSAEKELQKLIEDYYQGKIADFEFINWNPD